MHRTSFSFILISAFLLTHYTWAQDKTAPAKLIDNQATSETKALFQNLKNMMGKSVLFGHQDATWYGINEDGTSWKNDADRSDVKSVCGSHPALYGWDVGGVVKLPSERPDSVTPAIVRKLIIEAYNRGGVNTISWHVQNFVTGKNFYDTTRCVSAILPGGPQHEVYKNSLNTLADYFLTLKGADGKLIPIIFRPYHEHTGNWFWWGRKYCTIEEYKALWQFTVKYFRDTKKIHHLIYAYSPDRFTGVDEYLERYPGDAYVDILAHDNYWDFKDTTNSAKGVECIRTVVKLALERNKVAALSETGLEKITIPDWFTKVMFDPIKNDPVASKIAFLLVWRNGNKGHFFAPYPGHTSVPEFLKFYNDPLTLFQNDLKDIYKAK